SACIIARDEEQRLPACLASLAFCDEIVVVDSGSRDRTSEIAHQAGAVVFENPWPGFAIQRNHAIDRAHGDWVLEIDADERVTPRLAGEIRALVDRGPSEDMAAVPIRHQFLGGPLGLSARYPGYRHRLFRRTAFRHDEARTVHEGLWPDGPTIALDGDLIHLLAASWREARADCAAYARLESRQRPRPSARDAAIGIVVRPLVKFIYRAFLLGGVRDGGRGLVKVGLDCAADSGAQLLAIRRGRDDAEGPAFGQEAPRLGPVRIVGASTSVAGAERVAAWLRGAAAAGADVWLIAPSEVDDLPGRPLEGSGPGAFVRALDAADQLRPVDAVLLAGRRERAWLRLAPRALRGTVPPLDLKGDPTRITAALQESGTGADRN
ncbi:MAG TPA: glycosyltransferase family 2 protein, partial [Solirubrobacterales bacterium]